MDGERPRYREPHPVRPSAVAVGAIGALLWYLVFGLASRDNRSYAWLLIVASVVGGLASLVLARCGDRGVAVGTSAISAAALATAAVLAADTAAGGAWLLW